MKKTCFKILSLALTLVMLLGVVSAVNFTALAAGEGQTADNPVYVTTYVGLRDALANPNITYVKLGNTAGVKPVSVGSVQVGSGKYAISVVGAKHLTLDGTAKFGSVNGNSGLIALSANASLTIDGNGVLQYWHGQNIGVGAALVMTESGSTLTISAVNNVTIEGAGSADRLYDLWGELVEEEQNYAFAIYASNGDLNIHGGKFTGVRNTFDGSNNVITYAVAVSGKNVKTNITGGEFSSSSWLTYYNHAYGVSLNNIDPEKTSISGGTFYNGIKLGYISPPVYLSDIVDEDCDIANDVTGKLVNLENTNDLWDEDYSYTVYPFASMYDWGEFTPEWEDSTSNFMSKESNLDVVANFSFDATELSNEEKAKGFSIRKSYGVRINNASSFAYTNSKTTEGPLSGSVRFDNTGNYIVYCYIELLYHGQMVNRKLRGISYLIREDEKLTAVLASSDPPKIGSTMPIVINDRPEYVWMVSQWYTSDAMGHKLNALSNANRVQAGSYYALEIRCYGLPGYELADNAVCYLNGEVLTGVPSGDGVMVFTALYKTHDYYLNITDAVAPVYGENTGDYLYDYLPTVEDNFSDAFDQVGWYWQDENGVNFEGEFEKGKTYYLCYELIRDGGGLPLASQIFARVNREEPDDMTVQYSACLTVKKAFVAVDRIYDFDIIFTDDTMFRENHSATVDLDKTEQLLGASISGYEPTYQWYVNGFPVDGATEATYSFEDGSANDNVYVVMRAGAVWCRSQGYRIAYDDTINATIDTPVAGMMATDATSSFRLAEGSLCNVMNANWKDAEGNLFEGEFVVGEEYTFVVVLKRNVQRFNIDTMVLINGKPATVVVHIVDDHNAAISYTFVCEDNVLYGDANLDGIVNSLDAAQVLKHDAFLIELEGAALIAADVNGDGTVNSLDAAQILKYDAFLIEKFPVEEA